MKKIVPAILLSLWCILFISCEKLDVKPVTKVETGEITILNASSAIAAAEIIDLSGGANDDHGFCYATHPNPTVSDIKVSLGKPSVGSIDATVEGLNPGSTVFIRAYCMDEAGPVYGEVFSITLPDGVATITTTEPSSITTVSAISGGTISDDGGAPITARGVVWSTSQNPTTTNNQGITSDGIGTGEFISIIKGLSNNTYYVRAYAINSLDIQYGNQVSFSTPISDGPGTTITDVDGNTYNTIWINDRQWMKENLRTTKYRNGTTIPLVTDNGEWESLSTPAYCWYNNDIDNKPIYGALYNWYTVNTGNLCPTGWHVPTDAEWTALTDYVGSNPGTKLKATIGWDSDGNGSDMYGFSALPGGFRLYYNDFIWVGRNGYWWSSSPDTTYPDFAWYRRMSYGNQYVERLDYSKKDGNSVRCIRD